MHPASRQLPAAIATLRRSYGRPRTLPRRDPFEWVLYENIAYLTTPARRDAAFALLAATIGTTPEALLAAKRSELERVTAHGILKQRFAEKLRECARIALDRFGGNLRAALSGPERDAARALRRFPGIGVPGADRILLFCGLAMHLAPESNGLRVLARLGFIDPAAGYAHMYRASRTLEQQLPEKIAARREAHLLLQRHGQTICLRAAPRCGECPLSSGCRHARSGATPAPQRTQGKPARA